LSIDAGAVGKAIHGLRLDSGGGDYAVRVYASNRGEAARRYAELYNSFRNPLADEFQQAKKQLEGLERYLIQLWREYLSPRRPGALSGSSGASAYPGPPAGPRRGGPFPPAAPAPRLRAEEPGAGGFRGWGR